MKNKEVFEENKYSNKGHIDLDDIPISDTLKALGDFSNGSRGLEICLRIMWQHGLKTYSCYPGDRDVFDIGYIVMAEDEDVFSYLSEKLLSDESIRIDIENERQVIKFLGSWGEKNSVMVNLAQDILTGKKNNSSLISSKIGQPLPTSWVRKLQMYSHNNDEMHWGGKVLMKRK